jgi:hypothetical protein
MPTFELAVIDARARLAKATWSLQKVTTPEGERWITTGGHHVLVHDKSSDSGASSGASSGAASGDGGGYAYGTLSSQKNWAHLSVGDKQDRIGELWLKVANTANYGTTPEARQKAKDRLARWNDLKGNRVALEQSMGAYHEALRANTGKPQPQGQGQGQGQGQAKPGAVDLNWEPPAGSVRAKIADASKQTADISRTVSSLLDSLSSFSGNASNTGKILGATAGIAAGITMLAAAFHIASKARDAGAVATAINTASKATQDLRTHMPDLLATVKSPGVKAEVKATVAQLSTKLGSLQNSLAQTRVLTSVRNAGSSVQTAATRGAFRATGGTIVPAPAYPFPITTIFPKTYRTGAKFQPAYIKPTTISRTTPYRPSTNVTYRLGKSVTLEQSMTKLYQALERAA